MPRHTIAATVVTAVVVAACSSNVLSPLDDPSPTSSAPSIPVTPATPTTEAEREPGGSAEPFELCAGLVAGEVGRVTSDRLTEASGIVASERLDGVLWAHNDSGHDPGVFALGLDGTHLGRFDLDVAGQLVDVEDVALAGDQLYLADIGDNDRGRDEVAVYRFTEPDPYAGDGGARVRPVEQIRLRYPDGPRDAEALLVDSTTGTLVVIDKDVAFASDPDSSSLLAPAPGHIYTATPPFTPGEVHQFEPAGTIELEALANRGTAPAPAGVVGDLGVAGVVTGTDLRADGQAIALRTYSTVWLFARSEGQPVTEALAGTPCEAPTVPEDQGEAVAFLTGSTSDLVTVGEGMHPPVNAARTG